MAWVVCQIKDLEEEYYKKDVQDLEQLMEVLEDMEVVKLVETINTFVKDHSMVHIYM